MISRIMRTLIENPNAINLVGKANYNASIALGGDPVAYGQLAPNDPRVPSWGNNFSSGVSYYSQTGEVITYDYGHPATSVMQKILGGINWNPNLAPWENVWTSMKNTIQDNAVEGISPVYKVAQMGLNFLESNGGGYKSPDVMQSLTDMTGIGQISRITGLTPINGYGTFLFNSTGTVLPIRSGYKDQQDFNQKRDLAWMNYFGPGRMGVPSLYGDAAEQERVKYNNQVDSYSDPNNPDMLEKLWGWMSGQQ